MRSEPEIVRELREAERLGLLRSCGDSVVCEDSSVLDKSVERGVVGRSFFVDSVFDELLNKEGLFEAII
ncbi:MAG TPA: hypothetical protein ENI42_07520, partial [Thermoplasmatales archaeon]|nr:hypothetical protein [Thermoplasmatales archaeon]